MQTYGCVYIYIYIYIHIYIYIYINFEAINNVLDAKMVSKTYLFIKIFRLLYRSFVSLIGISRNFKQKSTQQLIQTNQNYKRTDTLKSSKV